MGDERKKFGLAWMVLIASGFLLEITIIAYAPRFVRPDHMGMFWGLSRRIAVIGVYAIPVAVTLGFLAAGVLVRIRPRLADMPNRYYWLAPERSTQTARVVATWLHALGTIVNLWLMVVALAVLVWCPDILKLAEESAAPAILVWTLFFVPVIAWLVMYMRRFWRVEGE